MLWKRIDGIARLARYKEYLSFVVVTTLLGAATAGGQLDWRLLVVLIANWLAVGFAFMINDVEDAPDDALNPAKVKRNPVSAGDLSPRLGWAASFGWAGAAAALYALLGLWPFVVGAACLALGFIYSWRRIRLKCIPVADLISHGLMLAGLQFLTGYLTFGSGPAWRWVFPLTFVVAISLYGQLFNELRDLEGDLEAGLTHTASLVGQRVAHILMMTLFAIGVASALVTVFVIHLVPLWVVIVTGVLAALLSARPLLRVRHYHTSVELQQPFQKPLEYAAAITFGLWFAGPWALEAMSKLLPVLLP